MSDTHVFNITEEAFVFTVLENILDLSVADQPVTFDVSELAITFPVIEEALIFTADSDQLTFDLAGIGIQGPAGPPGINEDDIVYAKRIDWISDTVLYRGEADVGSASSSAVWRIRRITLGDDDDVTEEWANGDAAFDKIWDNRAGFTYS